MAYLKLLLFLAVLTIAAVTAEEEKKQDLKASESGVRYWGRYGYGGYPRHGYGRQPGYKSSTHGPAAYSYSTHGPASYSYSRFVLGRSNLNRYDHDNHWHGDGYGAYGLGYGRHCYGNCRYGYDGYGRRYGGYDWYGRRQGGYGGYVSRYGYSPYGRHVGYRRY